MRKLTKAVVLILIVCLVLLGFMACSFLTPLKADTTNVEIAQCVRVVDGDTLVVKINNKEEKVRLVGVDTPESVSSDESKNCEEGKIASDYTKSLVSENQTLWLTKDVSDTDKYGRLLRFVWLSEPKQAVVSDEDITNNMLNAILVKDGYAQAKDYQPDISLSGLFHELGKQAQENNLGVTYKWKY